MLDVKYNCVDSSAKMKEESAVSSRWADVYDDSDASYDTGIQTHDDIDTSNWRDHQNSDTNGDSAKNVFGRKQRRNKCRKKEVKPNKNVECKKYN